MMEVTKILVAIMIVNHMLACAWFAIGQWFPGDTGLSWLDAPLASDPDVTYKATAPLYQYTTSLHWTMTQMTPGSMQVVPLNSLERVFNFCCLVLGILVFGSLVSSLSSKLMQYRAWQQEQNTNMIALCDFLRENAIQPQVAVAVQKQAEVRMSKERLPVVVKDVAALKWLTGSMRRRLQLELCKSHLRHPLFRWWLEVDSESMKHLCYEAVDSALQGHGRVYRVKGELEIPADGWRSAGRQHLGS